MLIKVQVRPDAGAEYFGEDDRGRYEAYVKEPPANNLANKRVIMLAAEHFKVPVASVRIVSGHRSFGKILDVKK